MVKLKELSALSTETVMLFTGFWLPWDSETRGCGPGHGRGGEGEEDGRRERNVRTREEGDYRRQRLRAQEEINPSGTRHHRLANGFSSSSVSYPVSHCSSQGLIFL